MSPADYCKRVGLPYEQVALGCIGGRIGELTWTCRFDRGDYELTAQWDGRVIEVHRGAVAEVVMQEGLERAVGIMQRHAAQLAAALNAMPQAVPVLTSMQYTALEVCHATSSVTLTEAAARQDVSRQTVYDHLPTLVSMGLVIETARGRYGLTERGQRALGRTA